jgi:hypothetical protein
MKKKMYDVIYLPRYSFSKIDRDVLWVGQHIHLVYDSTRHDINKENIPNCEVQYFTTSTSLPFTV